MSFVESFDAYPDIAYWDISHLFWNKFPYKVMVNNFLPSRYTDYDVSAAIREQRRVLRRKFFYSRKRWCPKDSTTWKAMQNNGSSYSFFFLNAEDAAHFIKKNRRWVVSAYRPISTDHIDELRSNPRSVVRKNLFWNQYRWCIIFKTYLDPVQENTLDEWATEHHPHGSETSYYTFSRTRRLYLKTENDMILARIAMGQFVQKIQKTILLSEIPNERIANS